MQALLDQLNPEQLQAVTHSAGPAVVLAGAGSGKTRVLTTRVAWLIKEQQIKPQQVLLVTFTNKAANEMNRRVFDYTGFQLPFSGTFHSLCAKILRLHGSAINLQPGFTIYDSDDQLSLIRQIYKDQQFDSQTHKPQKIRAMISSAKNDMLSIEEYANLASNSDQEFAAKVYKLYNRALAAQQAVDFDDLLGLTVKLLQQNKLILGQYQDQFQHVLVDEYQDTNKAQYLLTKLLARPQNNLYVVGDFAQSIYAWRGADYRNLFYLENDFDQLQKYKLERNYRSTQTILDAASQVIAQNTSHPILKLWTEKTQQEKIIVLENENNEEEALQITRIIKEQLNTYQLKDIAILYRTNAQSRPFEEAFIRYQLPYRVVGGFKFYERSEVKDVLAYLHFLVNPFNEVSLNRALKLGKRRFAQFETWKNQQKNQDFANLAPFELLTQILEATHYLDKYDEKNPDEQSKIDNVNELLAVASKFENSALFLENIALIQDDYLKDQPFAQEPNRLTLMSLHSAKGLEFPVVFMVGMEEGLLPHSRAIWDSAQLEEERRLCYVGITRACQKLFFSYALNRYQYGQSQYASPSRFLGEISADLLKIQRQAGSAAYQKKKEQSTYDTKPANRYWQQKWGNRGLDEEMSNEFGNRFNSASGTKTASNSKRRLVVDEDSIEALMNDEMDIDEFLGK